MKIINFGSRREDHNTLATLHDGEESLTFPRVRKIQTALTNLSKNSSKRNIEYLMAIADSNKYGLRSNSALRRYLSGHSEIDSKSMENNNWDSQLQRAIKEAIKKLPKNKQQAFEYNFRKMFVEPKKLTGYEKRLIKYREYIIKSKPMQEALSSADEKEVNRANRALLHMDYFIASSETPIKERAYVLSKLAYMMSDKYKINAQLQNRKAEVFSQIINDLVVKTPQSSVLTTKDCSQQHSGSCAAISMARKTLLYEDKKAYIDTVLSEIDNKPYMYIYDVTRLMEYFDDPKKQERQRAPKVKVPKANIDYKRADELGYRIIDASLLHWMKIAGSIGDGTINLENYIPFDSKNNDFMHDTRIVLSLDREYGEQHSMLRTLIKARNLLKDYDKAQLKKKVKEKEYAKYGISLEAQKGEASKKIRAVLDTIAPKVSVSQKTDAISKMLDLKRISPKNNDEVLRKQIVNHFSLLLGEQYRTDFEKTSGMLVSPVREYIELSDEIFELKNPLGKKIAEAENLFKLGVAQRAVVVQGTKVDSITDYMYEELGLPSRSKQIKNEVKRLKKLALQKPNSPYIQALVKNNGNSLQKTVEMLNSSEHILEKEIPETIDALLEVYGTSYKQILIQLVEDDLKSHNAGKYETMYNVSEKLRIVPNPEKFRNRLETVLERLKEAKTDEDLSSAMALVAVDNRNDCVLGYVNEVAQTVNKLLEVGRFDIASRIFADDFKPADMKKMVSVIEDVNQRLEQVISLEEMVAARIGYPSKEEVIIRGNEDLGLILKKEELDALQAKFDAINRFKEKCQSAPHRSEVYVGDIFKFTSKEKQWLKHIEKNIPKFRRDVSIDYKNINDTFKDELNKIYEELGKRKGFFWIGEEGHSGLYDSESIRIIEQMTGRPYYIEEDIDEIVRHVKDGEGSSASSTMVSYDEYSGHAQYIADIRPVEYKDPKTGKIKVAEALLHDNTWGKREFVHQYTDASGVMRTDYDRGYGGPHGFVLDKSGLAGEFVDDFKFDFGVDRTERTTKATEGPLVEIDNIDEEGYYSTMQGARLPGIDPRLKKRIDKIFAYLYNISSKEQAINELFDALEPVKNQVNIEIMEKGDDFISARQEELKKRIGTDGRKKMSVEEFNKLSPNDPLRIIIDRLIIRKALDIPEEDERLDDLKTQKSLEIYKKTYIAKQIKQWGRMWAKDLPYIKNEISGEIADKFEDEIIALKEKYPDSGLKSVQTRSKEVIKLVVSGEKTGSGKMFIRNLTSAVSRVLREDENMKDIPASERKELIQKLHKIAEDVIYPSTDAILESTEERDSFVHFIDKKFNPANNMELARIVRKIIDMDKSEFAKLVKNVTFDDMGIKFDKPENVLRLIQAGNRLETSRFDDESRYYYFTDYLPITEQTKGVSPVSKELAKFYYKYRLIDVELSNIGGEKYLKEFKDEVFRKWQVRPAIPNVQIKSDSELQDELLESMKEIQSTAATLRNFKITKKMLKTVAYANDAIANKKIDSERKKFLEAMNILHKVFLSDTNTWSLSIGAISAIIDELNTHKTVDYSRIKSLMGAVNTQQEETVLKGINLDNVDDFIKVQADKLHSLKNVVQINVLPRYQGKVSNIMNQWISGISKYPEKDKENKAKLVELVSEMVKHHVLKEPGDLLAYAVKFVSRRNPSITDEDYEQILQGLKSHLGEAYVKANKTQLEYKLMKAAKKGVAVKFRDYIKGNNMTVQYSDETGKHEVSTLSPKGIDLLIQGLADAGSNHSTLMLFVEQAGLVDDLLAHIYNTKAKTKKKEFIDAAKCLMSQKMTEKLIEDTFGEVYDNMPSEINITSLDQLYEFHKKLCEAFENKKLGKRISKALIQHYTDRFKAIVDNIDINMLCQHSMPVRDGAAGIHSTVIKGISAGVVELAKNYDNKLQELYDMIGILGNIRLAPDSKDDIKRNKFMDELQRMIDMGVRIINGTKVAEIVVGD